MLRQPNFTNKDLEENIYMEYLEGFVVFGQENKVCYLSSPYMD